VERHEQVLLGNVALGDVASGTLDLDDATAVILDRACRPRHPPPALGSADAGLEHPAVWRLHERRDRGRRRRAIVRVEVRQPFAEQLLTAEPEARAIRVVCEGNALLEIATK